MKIMTRSGWEKLVMDNDPRTFGGGDLWNSANIWRRAFAAVPEAVCARYDYIGTGLWCDVILTLSSGERIDRRIYG